MTLLNISIIIAIILVIGILLLPSQTTVRRETIINASPAEVFALLSTTEGFQRFNPYKDNDPAFLYQRLGEHHHVAQKAITLTTNASHRQFLYDRYSDDNNN